MEEKKVKKLDVDIDKDAVEGVYSNFFWIMHSPSEFLIDFGRFLPGFQKPKVYTRVVMTPHHFKKFFSLLKENLEKYESQFGEIVIKGEEHKDKPGFL